MKVPDGIIPIKEFSNPCVKLKRSLFELKQSGRMWYQRLSNFTISKGFKTNDIAPCLFIKRKNCSHLSLCVRFEYNWKTINACEGGCFNSFEQ